MKEDINSSPMTYVELAERLKIKPASAKRLAQRRKWYRVVGNDGVARVHVPYSVVSHAVTGDVAGVVTGDVTSDLSSPVTPEILSRIAYLEGLVEGLQGQLEAEKQKSIIEKLRAVSAEERIKDITADREAWRQQAQRSIWSRLFGLN